MWRRIGIIVVIFRKLGVRHLEIEIYFLLTAANIRAGHLVHASVCYFHWPLARYVKLRVAHAPGTFSQPSRVSDPDMQHGACVTHVPWYIPGSLTSGFLWSRWRGKRSRHSRRMRNLQFYISGKRPIHRCIINSLAPGDVVVIFKGVISEHMLGMDFMTISCEIDLRTYMLISQHCFRQCRKAPSHYLIHCWPRSMSPYGVNRPQWVKTCVATLLLSSMPSDEYRQ